MTDSLRAAAALADKLGGDFETILPDTEPVIDCDALAATRVELRQVAGISAGGCIELRPGNYDFGTVRRGPGRLEDGQPETVGFTLSLNGELAAIVGPGEGPVLLDDQPIVEPTDLGGRVINAGSARFVVARPRPPQRRGGPAREIRLDDVDRWVLEPIPRAVGAGGDLAALIEQRRRLHYGPDEIRHRIEAGPPLVWDRDPSHPLFGTAVVAMADIPLRGSGLELAAPVPVSVDLLDSMTMVVGERRLQLAVVRHIILALAAATHPDHLGIGVLSDRSEFDFVNQLPHAEYLRTPPTEAGPPRRLLVVDNPARYGDWSDGQWHDGRWNQGRWTLPGVDPGHTSILAVTGEGDLLAPDADVLTIIDEATISILGNSGEAPLDRATPVGFAHSMADDLVDRLRLVAGLPAIQR